LVARAQELALQWSSVSLDDLLAKLRQMRARDWRSNELLIDFCAVSSELVRRTLDIQLHGAQLLALVSVLRGAVADLATGEGKTVVGVLAALGFALQGRRIHLLTANDYLAVRDEAFARTVFAPLGVSSSSVTSTASVEERQRSYTSQVVYTTIHQVGFDVLQDRQATRPEDRRLRDQDVVVIDEIDAVLIDEALTPLILAGAADDATEHACLRDPISQLQPRVHYVVDDERRNVSFTEAGYARVESALGVSNLFARENADLLTAANVALHAEVLLQRDTHYIVTDTGVRIISPTQGRIDDRQRWPDGLQAAIESKEGLPPSSSAETLDQILIETVVKSYSTIVGMSGTALDAAERLWEDYSLRTVAVPPHRSRLRIDEPDRLFACRDDRDAAAIERLAAAHAAQQPVLVGTQSVSDSEAFARRLAQSTGIEAIVLNAKNHAEEAEVITSAGSAGAVTISTQMAGRGVDIRLDERARSVGGLLIIGLERHASLRVDHQLIGRAGRQGDPGRSVFYTSFDDDVVVTNLEGSELIPTASSDGPLGARHRRLYTHAQRVSAGKVLQLHRKTRAYSAVIEQQRLIVLRSRDRLLSEDNALVRHLEELRSRSRPRLDTCDLSGLAASGIARRVVLTNLDRCWKVHLAAMTDIRDGIHLRILGRQNPLVEFQLLAGRAFETFFQEVDDLTAEVLWKLTLEPGLDLRSLGMERPGTTWTYMVQDNPFGSAEERFIRYLANVVHGRRQRTGVDR
jgi:preprotein translocase subunit SecA